MLLPTQTIREVIGMNMRLAALLGFLVFILSACGGSGDNGSDTPDPETATQTDSELAQLISGIDFGDTADVDTPALVTALPQDRASLVSTGAQAKTNVQSLIQSGAFVGATKVNEFWCSDGECICFGDDDCNDMFSTVCSDPGTGGSCIGNTPVCVCRIN